MPQIKWPKETDRPTKTATDVAHFVVTWKDHSHQGGSFTPTRKNFAKLAEEFINETTGFLFFIDDARIVLAMEFSPTQNEFSEFTTILRPDILAIDRTIRKRKRG